MYRFIAKEKANRKRDCATSCKTCKMCKKDTRDYDDCWAQCDNCNRCHADYHNSKQYNEPYEYRPWFLSVDNHSFSVVPYSKQFCDNICGVRMCKKYRKRLNDYDQCRRCQIQGMCWSPYQERCIKCDLNSAMKPCEDKYGCPNPEGYEFGNVPPINPMFTNCNACWDQTSYTTL
jgi:hypothetical protein